MSVLVLPGIVFYFTHSEGPQLSIFFIEESLIDKGQNLWGWLEVGAD